MMNIFITMVFVQQHILGTSSHQRPSNYTEERTAPPLLHHKRLICDKSHQRGWEDRVESHFWPEARDKPQKEDSHNSTFTCKTFLINSDSKNSCQFYWKHHLAHFC